MAEEETKERKKHKNGINGKIVGFATRDEETDTNKSRVSGLDGRLSRGANEDKTTEDQLGHNSEAESYHITKEKILKIVFALFLFLLVFFSGLIARITLHILIWNIHPPEKSSATQKQTFAHSLNFRCRGCINGKHLCSSVTDTKSVNINWIWAIFLVIVAPYLATFLRTFFRIIFKRNKRLDMNVFLLTMLMETLHSFGIVLFAFVVLPSFDPVTASVAFMGVLILPPIVEMIDKGTKLSSENDFREKEGKSINKKVLSKFLPIIGCLFQIAGITLVLLFSSAELWVILSYVAACLCLSVKHLENFISLNGKGIKTLRNFKRRLQEGRTKIACLVNFWKIIFTFLSMLIIFPLKTTDSNEGLLALFGQGNATLKDTFGGRTFGQATSCSVEVPYLIAVVCIMCGFLYNKAAKTVCVIDCQRFGFYIPSVLLPIVTTGALIGFVSDPEFIRGLSSCDMFLYELYCWTGLANMEKNWYYLVLGFLFLWVSYLIICRHVWKTHGFKHGETTRIFVSPFYCGLTLDVSTMLNRRRDDREYDDILGKLDPPDSDKSDKPRNMLYACCATMWHETENEMKQLLKSIFRLDKAQFKNKYIAEMQEKVKENGKRSASHDVETFDMEAHVFFDDAFDEIKDGERYPDVNEYVKTFTKVLEEAGSIVHGRRIEIEDGEMHRAPYGGRIEYKLPGGNILMVHLKDKSKIRHKKRWSQVMYMFYILDWKLGETLRNSGISFDTKEDEEKEKLKMAENTFLLALDGDVDFEPEALLSLMRRMNKSKIVGAACGRIHPIGNGPMVWYQKFEYAISHWLQKATEHVIGCVLCSPGCFSLFRGSAMLHADVIRTYTTVASEASQYIQYDQGEDRWLCTLLLKEGWRVEYCAESDAYTFAPEGFYEFYNQRRRWSPSTMANILDLILDWKNVTKKNENISFLYSAYHMFLFACTLLTPGTIFMIILGAIVVGFSAIQPYLALILNLIPVGIFLLLTLYASTARQLQYAAVLSVIYAIVMAIVMIGVIKDAADNGICSMTTIFIIFVAGVFVIAALVHPMEFLCLIPGLLYFLAIPSMSMLMFLYSIGNLHVVSWGTRETKQQTDTTAKATKHVPENQEKGYFCQLGKWVSCLFCPTNNYTKEDFIYNNMMTEFQKLQNQNGREPAPSQQAIQQAQEETVEPVIEDVVVTTNRDDSNYHIYFDDKTPEIDDKEKKFWKKKIKKYLKPLEKDSKKEETIQEELIELRNKVCLFVYLLNAILITVMFWLTQVSNIQNSLQITFSCLGRDAEIVPIALLFTVVFGILLLIQFLCMIYHRFSTLVHITASTDIWESEDAIVERLQKKYADLATSCNVSTAEDNISKESDKALTVPTASFSSSHRPHKIKSLYDIVKENEKKNPDIKRLEGSLYRKQTVTKNAANTWMARTSIKSKSRVGSTDDQTRNRDDDEQPGTSNDNRFFENVPRMEKPSKDEPQIKVESINEKHQIRNQLDSDNID